jgi:two-component system OmpR family response regulator
MVVYQAVPAPVDPPGAAVQIVLVIDVPIGLEAAAGEAMRLADDFGMTISHWLPGVRAQKAVMSARTEPPHRDSADPQTQTQPQPQPQTGLMIDLANRRVTVDGQPLRLAYREFALFAYLAAKPHRTLSRTTLLYSVWSDRRAAGEPISERTVDTHIRRLRAKLGAHARVLTTVRGHGYRFDPGADVRFRTGVLRRLAN